MPIPTGDVSAKIDAYMKTVLTNAMQNLMVNGNYYVRKKEFINPLESQIVVQFCYNSKTNKAYIEYDFTDTFRANYSAVGAARYINSYIKDNFKENTDAWPEIIAVEDGSNEVCDSSLTLTPYVIGYWESLYGAYRFLTDKAEVLQAANGLNVTAPDVKPSKKFEDFCDIVKYIDEKYRQTLLSETDKSKYILEYQDIYVKYHDTPDFDTKLTELKNKYAVKSNINSKVPDMFDEYKEKYEEFFDSELPDIHPYIRKSYYNVMIDQ